MMKTITFLFTSLLISSLSFSQKKPIENQKNQKIEKIINSQWTFQYFPSATSDRGYESPGYDDSKWKAISLPHTWATYESIKEFTSHISDAGDYGSQYWRQGWGWYRKHFIVRNEFEGKKIFIEFEGVQKLCRIWLNGKYVGEHNGRFGSFDFDITSFVKPGQDNLLAVSVNNPPDPFESETDEHNPDSYGGINRNVTIVFKNNLYIPMQGSASHEGGAYVTTPHVSEKEGIVRIQTWVKNENTLKKSCTLVTSIADSEDKIIQVIKSEAEINPGQVYKFDQTAKTVKNPHLWSIENPYLYMVSSQVMDGKTISDNLSSHLGFRWYRWDNKENCIYLNDKKVKIIGGNLNQDYLLLGTAIPGWITILDLENAVIKLHRNFIKNSNYPASNLIFDFTDKHGVIADEMFCEKKEQDPSMQDQQIKEIIRRDRNHPSIFFWECGPGCDYNAISKSAKGEDSTRLIPNNVNVVNEAELPANTIKTELITVGQPVRVVLKGSQTKIPADRSSIVILQADIVDINGNRVDGSEIPLKWSFSGPANLAGPEISAPGNNATGLIRESTNIIRSSGKAGRIHVSASSSGLSSGSFDIDAVEVSPDNSIIEEPVLKDEGRTLATKVILNDRNSEDVPVEIKPVSDEFNFGKKDISGYSKAIKEFVINNNSHIDSISPEFKMLISLFSSQLSNSEGNLKAEDYNFSIDHYNNCRLISGYISSTKLPQLFKDGLRQYYSEAIIKRGIEKNAGDEMNWLNWIPSGGTVVIVQSEKPGQVLKGAIYTKNNGLLEIISLVYPQFMNFSEEAKARALLFISKANPFVHSVLAKDGLSYSAETGKPILIPLIKFISE